MTFASWLFLVVCNGLRYTYLRFTECSQDQKTITLIGHYLAGLAFLAVSDASEIYYLVCMTTVK